MQDSVLNDSSPLVSIIIPVYQVEEYIEECVVSVVTQTYKNLEIIIIDDCGTDNSISIAKKILSEQEIPWKILKHEKNRGLSAARNTGVDNSTGEFIYFLDSDDYLDCNCISNMLSYAHRDDTDMIFGNFLYKCNNHIYAGYCTRTEKIDENLSPLEAYISGKSFPMACHRLIRKKAYIDSGISFIQGIIHEDEPWSFSMALKIKKVAYIDSAIYYYRQRKESITENKKNDFLRVSSLLVCIKAFSKENAQLYDNVRFQYFFAGRFMHLLYALDSKDISWKEKKAICNQMFALPNIPLKELKQIPAFRLICLLSTIIPQIWSVLISAKIKKCITSVIHKIK